MSPLGCSSQQWHILLVASLVSHLPYQENSIFVRLVRCTIFKISYKFPYNSYSPCSTAYPLSNKQMLIYGLWEDSWKKGHSYLDSSPLVFLFLFFPPLLTEQGDPVPCVKRSILWPWGCKAQAKKDPAENSQRILASPGASLGVYTIPECTSRLPITWKNKTGYWFKLPWIFIFFSY